MTTNNLIKTTLLSTKTVASRMQRLRMKRVAECARHEFAIKELNKQERLLRIRCPHDKTRLNYGQYERCTEICDTCGADLG